MPPPYDPKAYWIARHGELKGDIRAVGNKGKSAEENEVLYARRNRQLRALLRREAQVRPLRHAVEFGCGIGMLAPAFVRSGLRYTGVDVSPVAIEAARARCPSGAFVEADIRDFEPPERADVVLVASVLCHMVEERDWRAVLARLSGALAPGGILILGEQLPRRVPIPYKDYVLHRTFEATRTALAEHGLILRRRGADLYSAGRPAEAGP